MFTDVTIQKKLENCLQESHTLLKSLSRQVPGMIHQLRMFPDGRFSIPYSSDAIRDAFGTTPNEVRDDASAAFAVVHPDDLDEMLLAINGSARTLQALEFEFRVVPPFLL
jgi:hypothetical protein